MTLILPGIVLLGAAATAAYFFFFSKMVSAEPDEWMIVVRNGEVVAAGVGISRYIRHGDRVVKFPSKINKVNFSAQQVTKEMQGVELNGALIWSVFREKDGPIRAYRFLGEDIRNSTPTTANAHMVEMSNAIVRHRIANSTLDEILRNRDLIRNEIRNEMNGIVNGWGVWLESVEITDVKILSGTLFTNMQMPFREEQRLKAETIRMKTDLIINENRITTELKKTKTDSERDSSKNIYKSQQTMKVSEENAKNAEAELALKKNKVEFENQMKQNSQKLENEFDRATRQRKNETEFKRLDRQVELEKKRQELEAIKEQTKEQSLGFKIKRQAELEDTKRKQKETKVTSLNNLKKQSDFRFAALKTCKNVFSAMPLENMRVVNFDRSGKDQVHGFVDQLLNGIAKFEKATS